MSREIVNFFESYKARSTNIDDEFEVLKKDIMNMGIFLNITSADEYAQAIESI